MVYSPSSSGNHNVNVERRIVMAEAFEPHPEGYEPRIFTTTGKDVYELLRNGCVVPRPSLPPQMSSFDWWYIRVEGWSSMTMNRRPAPPVIIDPSSQ